MVTNYTDGISPVLPANPVLSTWLPLKNEQPESPGPGYPMKPNSPLGFLTFISCLWDSMTHQVFKDWKKHSLQSWGLQCLGNSLADKH